MKQNDELFQTLKSALHNGDKKYSLALIAELDGKKITAEDQTHLAAAKKAIENGNFEQALSDLKYLW